MDIIIIKPKDVAIILNCHYETARRKIKAIKDSLSTKNKKVSHVTISQFASEYNIPEEQIRQVIQKS